MNQLMQCGRCHGNRELVKDIFTTEICPECNGRGKKCFTD